MQLMPASMLLIRIQTYTYPYTATQRQLRMYAAIAAAEKMMAKPRRRSIVFLGSGSSLGFFL